MKVDFIGIGGQRCGTTWLFQTLKEHPKCGMSSEKELHYFSHNYHYGLEWYEKMFLSENKLNGEFSTSYFYNLKSPKRIFDYNPDMKIILSIRNPIDRFLSHHKHELQKQRFLNNTVDPYEVLKNNKTYIEYGLYFKALTPWLEYFSNDNIFIIIFDEIISNPKNLLSRLYKFLNIDNNFIPSCIDQKINEAWLPKYKSLLYVQKSVSYLSRKIKIGFILDLLKKIGVTRKLQYINSDQKYDILKFDNNFKNDLEKYFIEDINKMSKYLKKDLEKMWF